MCLYSRLTQHILLILSSVFEKNEDKKLKEERRKMQLYQFEKIYSQMEKEFGKIRKGDEETYSMLLLPMESNALKIHRKFPASNSRRMKEAIALVLFDIKIKMYRRKF